MTALPRVVGMWTVDDLDHLPDDGLQYELVDGALLVTPAPFTAHQRVCGNLYLRLRQACPSGYEVFFAPVDWRPDRSTSLQPDLLVVRSEDVGVADVTAPLVLAVEVVSPATSRKDRTLKRSKYQDAGVGTYWIVDPAEPALEAFDLVDGEYVVAARASGGTRVRLELPFAIEIVPAELVLAPL